MVGKLTLSELLLVPKRAEAFSARPDMILCACDRGLAVLFWPLVATGVKWLRALKMAGASPNAANPAVPLVPLPTYSLDKKHTRMTHC